MDPHSFLFLSLSFLRVGEVFKASERASGQSIGEQQQLVKATTAAGLHAASTAAAVVATEQRIQEIYIYVCVYSEYHRSAVQYSVDQSQSRMQKTSISIRTDGGRDTGSRTG